MKKFIKLNVNTGISIKNLKLELNTKIASAISNMQKLKMI